MKQQDRKELVRAYHEAGRPMGVYRVAGPEIEIVGSSVDLPSALNRHRAQLELGGHPDHALQAEWGAAGPDAFTFEILDVLDTKADRDPTDDLRELETMWRERLGSD